MWKALRACLVDFYEIEKLIMSLSDMLQVHLPEEIANIVMTLEKDGEKKDKVINHINELKDHHEIINKDKDIDFSKFAKCGYMEQYYENKRLIHEMYHNSLAMQILNADTDTDDEDIFIPE